MYDPQKGKMAMNINCKNLDIGFNREGFNADISIFKI